MTDEKAVRFTRSVFESIKKSKSIADLENIPGQLKIPQKNQMKIDGYPKIEFDIQPADIEELHKKELLDREFNFMTDITTKLSDPLSKLLYAIAWKNGDLSKIKHIIQGIRDAHTENEAPDSAPVFYQFGKYLTKKPGEPIIDQHVIRAYALYSKSGNEEIEKYRRLDTLDKTHKPIINEYKRWLNSGNLTKELRSEQDYLYYIDKLLYATGKTIKFRKPRKS